MRTRTVPSMLTKCASRFVDAASVDVVSTNPAEIAPNSGVLIAGPPATSPIHSPNGPHDGEYNGLDEEELRHVFEPYFSTKATGTGLGLTIARRNVELHDGTVAVQSVKGRGTTVTIELPTAAPTSGQ